MMNKRLKIVGVMGDGKKDYPGLTEPLGRAIAEAGSHLLTGAGDGVMEGVARAFTAVSPREGFSIGIVRAAQLPANASTNDRRWKAHTPPNDYVEISINTHLPDSGLDGKLPTSRNHINVLSADVIIVLPGGPGTFSEAMLALEYRRNVVFYVGGHTIGGMKPEEILKMVPGAKADFIEPADIEMVKPYL
jgi:uncharacterized protein (TIGR00725 family)